MGTARDSVLIGQDTKAAEYGESVLPVKARDSQERAACARAKEAVAKPLSSVSSKWGRGGVAHDCEGKCPVCKKVRVCVCIVCVFCCCGGDGRLVVRRRGWCGCRVVWLCAGCWGNVLEASEPWVERCRR